MTHTVISKVSFFDGAHLAIMLVALGVSYLLPFDLVLLSYAILGPMHYLTEISWLHERSYFMPNREWAWPLVVLTMVALNAIDHPTIGATLLWFAFGFSGLTLLVPHLKTAPRRAWSFVGIFILCGIGFFVLPTPAFILVALLPTVIHISLFTFLFMVTGAQRAKTLGQYILVASYVVCVTLLLFFPSHAASGFLPQSGDVNAYFGEIGRAFNAALGNSLNNKPGRNAWPLDARLAGFLSFAYTYHYLNWFIKVGTIKWHRVPIKRLVLIGGLGAAFTASYFIDYKLGFMLLLSLSLLHVVLEFPLNIISMKQLDASFRTKDL